MQPAEFSHQDSLCRAINLQSRVKICDSVAKCPFTLESANLLQASVSCKLTDTILFLSCDSGTESDGFLKINLRLYFCRGWSRGLNLNYPKPDNLTNNHCQCSNTSTCFHQPYLRLCTLHVYHSAYFNSFTYSCLIKNKGCILCSLSLFYL